LLVNNSVASSGVRGWHLIRSRAAMIFCLTTSLVALISPFLVHRYHRYLHVSSRFIAWRDSPLILNSGAGSCPLRFLSVFMTNKYVFFTSDISSASEKAFPGVLAIFCFVFELPQKRKCFNTQEFTRFLSTGVVSARVLSNKVIWVLGHFWVYIPHIQTSEWDSLFFPSCMLSTVTVTPSDSDFVSRSACLQ